MVGESATCARLPATADARRFDVDRVLHAAFPLAFNLLPVADEPESFRSRVLRGRIVLASDRTRRLDHEHQQVLHRSMLSPFRTLDYHFSPGFRVGVGAGLESDWGVKLSYTRFYTDTEDTAAGNVTPVFLGNRLALSLMDPPYFDSGSVQSAIDYNVLDLDFGKSFCPVESLQLRPVLGLRGAWIKQTFDAEFQGTWLDGDLLKTSDEHIKNSFWGIGPKLGIESTLNLWSGEKCRIDLALNFYTAYLLGCWAIHDVTIDTTDGSPIPFRRAHQRSSLWRIDVPGDGRRKSQLRALERNGRLRNQRLVEPMSDLRRRHRSP